MEINAGLMFPPFIMLACLIMSIPIFDIANVMIIRLRNGTGIFAADMNHIHHRLLKIGFSETGVLYILYSYTAILGLWSVLFLFITPQYYTFLFVIVAAMVILSMFIIVWAERDVLQTTYYNLITRKKYRIE